MKISMYRDTASHYGLCKDNKTDDNTIYLNVPKTILKEFFEANIKDDYDNVGFDHWIFDLYIHDDMETLLDFIKSKYGNLNIVEVVPEGSSFLSDYEKVIDFCFMSKEEFLKFYTYLTEADYEATIQDAIDRSGYWHKEWHEDNPDYDGSVLKDILFGMMLTEWLMGKEKN